MRNQFVGDIGDFAKYGLLRTLACNGRSARRLGVVSYKHRDSHRAHLHVGQLPFVCGLVGVEDGVSP